MKPLRFAPLAMLLSTTVFAELPKTINFTEEVNLPSNVALYKIPGENSARILQKGTLYKNVGREFLMTNPTQMVMGTDVSTNTTFSELGYVAITKRYFDDLTFLSPPILKVNFTFKNAGYKEGDLCSSYASLLTDSKFINDNYFIIRENDQYTIYVDVQSMFTDIDASDELLKVEIVDNVAQIEPTTEQHTYWYKGLSYVKTQETPTDLNKMLSFADKSLWIKSDAPWLRGGTITEVQGDLPWDTDMKISKTNADRLAIRTKDRLPRITEDESGNATAAGDQKPIRMNLNFKVPYAGVTGAAYRGNIQVYIGGNWVSQFDVNAPNNSTASYFNSRLDADGMPESVLDIPYEEMMVHYRDVVKVMNNAASIDKNGDAELFYSLLLPDWVSDLMKTDDFGVELRISGNEGRVFTLSEFSLEVAEDEKDRTLNGWYIPVLKNTASIHYDPARATEVEALASSDIPKWEWRIDPSKYNGNYSVDFAKAHKLGLVQKDKIIYVVRQDVKDIMYLVELWSTQYWYEPGYEGFATFEAWRQCWLVAGKFE